MEKPLSVIHGQREADASLFVETRFGDAYHFASCRDEDRGPAFAGDDLKRDLQRVLAYRG